MSKRRRDGDVRIRVRIVVSRHSLWLLLVPVLVAPAFPLFGG